jgi:NOP9-like PUF repeat domain
MKPVIPNELDLAPSNTGKRTQLPAPESFLKMASRILRQFRDVLDGNEVRALAVDKVASPVLQVSI